MPLGPNASCWSRSQLLSSIVIAGLATTSLPVSVVGRDGGNWKLHIILNEMDDMSNTYNIIDVKSNLWIFKLLKSIE